MFPATNSKKTLYIGFKNTTDTLNYNIIDDGVIEEVLIYNSMSSGSVSVTLPSNSQQGKMLYINYFGIADSSGFYCSIIQPSGTTLIDGGSLLSTYPNVNGAKSFTITVFFNGSNWQSANINIGASYIGVSTFYSTTSTISNPDSNKYKFAEVILIGAGGGGGSGRKGVAATARSGGAGGAAGTITRGIVDASMISGQIVTIGAGGSGGAAVTVNSTNGNAGGAGGVTMIGSYLMFALGGSGGSGGGVANLTGPTGFIPSYNNMTPTTTGSGNGGGTSVTANAGSIASQYTFAPTGAGAGGSISTANVAYTGSAGGNVLRYNDTNGSSTVIFSGGGAGVVDSTLPTSGSQIISTESIVIYTAPGGGAASLTTNAQSGISPANGYGTPGSGGGAAVDSTGNSGTGGTGRPGACYIRWF